MKFSECIKEKKFTVPDYQRAFIWEKKQIDLFIQDLKECVENNVKYYYGHFIFETIEKDKKYEIIDGQQRMTLAVLFLFACQDTNSLSKGFINNFETVSYDKEFFTNLLGNKTTKFTTFSQKRLQEGLNLIKKAISKISKDKISQYVKVLLDATISTHCLDSKIEATQIFKLTNTRGVSLTIIEKVKSRLMQSVYENRKTNTDESDLERDIKTIQKCFAEIYKLEESMLKNSFKGHLDLDVLLHLHLRVIDTGLTHTQSAAEMDSPIRNGNREELILTYIDKKIKNNTNYALKLSEEFQKSVECFCKNLPQWDKETSLVGDVLILDRDKSIEFFLILYRLRFESYSKNDKAKVLKLWERLLFTRDFHDKYHGVWYSNRENFPKLFKDCIKDDKNDKDKCFDINVLNRYVKDGFSDDPKLSGNTKKLQSIVRTYIKNNKDDIKKNAYGDKWWNDKMSYILYKFEKHQGVGLKTLREIIKNGSSLDHILPREWDWEWIGAKWDNRTSDDETFNTEINKRINGIGNLILVSPNENSSKGNTHPADHPYNSIGGSYTEHNNTREKWRKPKNWTKIIDDRSEAIYDFLIDTMLPEWEYEEK